jgi:hypothetical protein
VLAKRHGMSYSLRLIWAEKHRKGKLTLDVLREVQIREYEQRMAVLERKVGQLTMELGPGKKEVWPVSIRPQPSYCRSYPVRGPLGHARVRSDTLLGAPTPPDRAGASCGTAGVGG